MGFIRRAFGGLVFCVGAIWVALGFIQQVLGIPEMPAQASHFRKMAAEALIWLAHANPNIAFGFAGALVVIGMMLMSGFQFQPVAVASLGTAAKPNSLKQEFVPPTFRFLKAIKKQEGLTSVQAERLMSDVIGKWAKVKGRVTGVSTPFGDVTVEIRDQRGFAGSMTGLSFTLRRSEWSHGRALSIGDEVVLIGRIYTVSSWSSMLQDAYFADTKDEREAIPFPDED